MAPLDRRRLYEAGRVKRKVEPAPEADSTRTRSPERERLQGVIPTPLGMEIFEQA